MPTKYTKHILSGVAAAAMLIGGSSALALNVNRFEDVPSDAWYSNAVQFAVDSGLFNGMSGNQFSPSSDMTRGMFVTVLGRYAKIDAAKYVGSSFNDVASNAYYASYSKWANEEGIVSGVGNGAFAPNESVTRQDLVKMMHAYVESTGLEVTVASAAQFSSFSDTGSVASYAAPAMHWAVENGIVNGSDGRLHPRKTATRAEVATLMMNFDKIVKGEVQPGGAESEETPIAGAITTWNRTVQEYSWAMTACNYDPEKLLEVTAKYADMLCGKQGATVLEAADVLDAMNGAPAEAVSVSDEPVTKFWARMIRQAAGEKVDTKPDAEIHNGNTENNSPNSTSTSNTVTDKMLRQWEDEMVEAVNVERRKAGVPELVRDEKLMEAARIWAEHLTTDFRHATSSEMESILNNVGYDLPNGNGDLGGENITGGSPIIADVVQRHLTNFMESEGHRDTMLNSRYTRIGIGYSVDTRGGLYCVQRFFH